MSVDFYDCKACGTTGVYEECIAATECCGQRVCDKCVVGEPDEIEHNGEYIYDWCDMPGSGQVKKKHCPFCSGTKVSDKQVIEYLLNITGLDREGVKKLILLKRNPPPPLDEDAFKKLVLKHYPDMSDFVGGLCEDENDSLMGGKYIFDFDYDPEDRMPADESYNRQSEFYADIRKTFPNHHDLIVVLA